MPGPEKESHVAILGGLDRKGGWIVPRELSVFCMMGGADLDLRRRDGALLLFLGALQLAALALLISPLQKLSAL